MIAEEEAPALAGELLVEVRTRGGVASLFLPPILPEASRRAFRFHMGYAVLDAVSSGIVGNVPLMAVKAMRATDSQLQMPLAMASIGMFSSVVTGAAMATQRKKPFVVVPGIAGALCVMAMAWAGTSWWFLFVAGLVTLFDFATRPAVPSIFRSVYPDRCRSHVGGTLRQYSSVFFLATNLAFAGLLSVSGERVMEMIRVQLMVAGVLGVASFICFWQLPDHGDGSGEETRAGEDVRGVSWWRHYVVGAVGPLRDRRYVRYVGISFLFAVSGLFYVGIIPAYLARDLKMGYVEATMLVHVLPAVAVFLTGGWMTAWIEKVSIWKSWSVIATLWAIDPLLLVTAPFLWPVLAVARVSRGIANGGSLVLWWQTGVHSFARPGADTVRYMAVSVMSNGVARVIAPTAAALVAGHLSRRGILLIGGMGVVVTAGMFWGASRQWKRR